jgi:hypothetical protein
VKIGPAHAARANPQQNLIRSGLGPRHLFNAKRPGSDVSGGVEDGGFHKNHCIGILCFFADFAAKKWPFGAAEVRSRGCQKREFVPDRGLCSAARYA